LNAALRVSTHISIGSIIAAITMVTTMIMVAVVAHTMTTVAVVAMVAVMVAVAATAVAVAMAAVAETAVAAATAAVVAATDAGHNRQSDKAIGTSNRVRRARLARFFYCLVPSSTAISSFSFLRSRPRRVHSI
jgi:hypothetical protein